MLPNNHILYDRHYKRDVRTMGKCHDLFQRKRITHDISEWGHWCYNLQEVINKTRAGERQLKEAKDKLEKSLSYGHADYLLENFILSWVNRS